MPSADEQTLTTSSDLLTRVRQHHPEAWRRFVLLYGPLVYGWCRGGGLGSSDSGDVMQDVFATVYTSIHGFRHDRPGDTLRGWMRVICRNKMHDHYRRAARGPIATGGTDGKAAMAALPDVSEDSDDPSTIEVERYGLVRRAAELVRAEFEPRTWQAFWLVAVDHKDVADAAAELQMSRAAVRQAKYKVLRRLREQLRGEYE